MDQPEIERIVIADDHPLFRGALRQALADVFGNIEILEAGTIDEVSAALGAQRPVDLVLLDLMMPGVKGFSGLIYIRSQFPDVPIVVVSASDDSAIVRRCIDFGAMAFLPKSLDVAGMRDAVVQVLSGQVWVPPDIDLDAEDDDETRDLAARLATLTPQQFRVLMMLSEGLLNKQIAYELSVSEATVKAHVSAILQKLNVDSRLQAVIEAGKIDSVRWAGAAADDT